jgi:hypothetical protein
MASRLPILLAVSQFRHPANLASLNGVLMVPGETGERDLKILVGI